MTSLDTVDTDGVAICRVARPTPETQTQRFRQIKRLKKDAVLTKLSASLGARLHFLRTNAKKDVTNMTNISVAFVLSPPPPLIFWKGFDLEE